MKRVVLIATLVGLAALLAAGPLKAAEPKPSIVDPEGDANFINDQGTGDGSVGDVEEAGSQSSFADLNDVTFTTDKKNLYVHIGTLGTSPPTVGEGFRVRTNPGAGGVYCLYFEAFFPGATNDLTAWKGHLRDACNANATVEGAATIGPLGTIMVTVPRAGVDALKKGATLSAPQAATFVWSGSYPAGAAGPFLDTTKPGTDYKLK